MLVRIPLPDLKKEMMLNTSKVSVTDVDDDLMLISKRQSNIFN